MEEYMAFSMQFSVSSREELTSSTRQSLVTTWASHLKWQRVLSTSSYKNSKLSIRKSSQVKEMLSRKDGRSIKKQHRLQRKKKMLKKIPLLKLKRLRTKRKNPRNRNKLNLKNLVKVSQFSRFRRSKRRLKRLSKKSKNLLTLRCLRLVPTMVLKQINITGLRASVKSHYRFLYQKARFLKCLMSRLRTKNFVFQSKVKTP